MLPTLAGGISFGVLAQPVMGSIAPVVMSLDRVLRRGAVRGADRADRGRRRGGRDRRRDADERPLAADGAGRRARSCPAGALKRAAQSLALVDASFALSSRGDGTYDRGILIGATLPQAAAWTGGTLIGVLGGSAIADPGALGLDAMFPAFFAVLLAGEARGKLPLTAAAPRRADRARADALRAARRPRPRRLGRRAARACAATVRRRSRRAASSPPGRRHERRLADDRRAHRRHVRR